MQIQVFLTAALVGGEWSVSRRGRFIFGETVPCTHWIEGWVNSRTGLDDVERRKILLLPGLELRPVRSQSLLRLRCPALTITYIYCDDLWATVNGIGLVNGFIDHLHTPLGTAINYNAIPNLHTLQITTALAKPIAV
jgi:hypothetical protein